MALRAQLADFTRSDVQRQRAIGAIVPHASFQFSGRIAGEALSRVAIPQRCVILAPNHTGAGEPWSVMAAGAYHTPLGEVPIDEALATALCEQCALIAVDERAHAGEHAIEVVLPFLQWLGPSTLRVAPLVMKSDLVEEYDQVAAALAEVVRRATEPVLLIASADLTHYEPAPVVIKHDAELLEAIEALDVREFMRRLHALRAATCSGGPIACLLGAATRLGATQAQRVCSGTSADAGGDPDSAIGYAGIIVH